ncbi:MAG: low temperature requirement protein A [Marmoricola sp.]
MGLPRRSPRVVRPPAEAVTSLELFFDLVFVFTITQLTATVLDGGLAVTGRCALLLLLLWWMYGGYAWLTNAAPPVTPRRRGLLVLGMLGNFVTAMAIPRAYGADRLAFACGYLLVVLVHSGMYVTEAARITRGMVVQLLGWNVLGAVLGVVGAVFFSSVLVWWWLGSFVVAVVVPRLLRVTDLRSAEPGGGPSFELVSGHFVERHGLMLLIALGESVLAIGVGLGDGGHAIDAAQVAFAAISLLLATTLYAAYFGVGEDERAEAALDALPPERVQWAALASYGYAFWVVLFAIVLTAAGLHHALAHPTSRLGWEHAGQLCVGVGGFWAGLGLFRRALRLPGAGTRVLTGVLLACVAPVGAAVSGLAALVLLLAGSAGTLLLERRASRTGRAALAAA